MHGRRKTTGCHVGALGKLSTLLKPLMSYHNLEEETQDETNLVSY